MKTVTLRGNMFDVAVKVAKKYRAENGKDRPYLTEGGFILIWPTGIVEVTGWAARLDSRMLFDRGTLAVDMNDNVYVLCGNGWEQAEKAKD